MAHLQAKSNFTVDGGNPVGDAFGIVEIGIEGRGQPTVKVDRPARCQGLRDVGIVGTLGNIVDRLGTFVTDVEVG